MTPDDRDATQPIVLPMHDEAILQARRAAAIEVAPHPPLRVPSAVAKQLLPSERVAFATRPHPVVVVRPLVALALFAATFAWALTRPLHPIVAGRDIGFATHVGILVAGAMLGLRLAGWLFAGAGYFAGFRIVATNRRIIETTGVLRRRVKPLGYGALASATLVQSLLGARFDYGTIVLPETRVRDVRDPGGLYREMQAVANGVDGDRWDPAIRQTLLP
jgi:hypothetical protein